MKKLISVFIFLIVILTLILIRSTNNNLFKNDANSLISLLNQNSITITKQELTESKYLIINLNDQKDFQNDNLENSINIPFNTLLEKRNQKNIFQPGLKIALYSNDINLSVKAFTILNQLGLNNLFILDADNQDEVLKYKFRPDTSIRPE